jgi:hypothetical protein
VVLALSVTPISCSSVQITSDVPCPAAPTLGTISQELELLTPKEVIETTTENYILLAKYIRKLEVRASCDKD